MHFFDRTLFLNPPIAELAELHTREQPKWLNYKSYLKLNKQYKASPTTLPKPAKVNSPSNFWTRDSIRLILIDSFLSNCAYCGIYSDIESDGEVDHHLPKALDTTAEYIYSWGNYVWSCHSCNNKKNNYYPILNPCIKDEMECLIFSPTTGNYDINTRKNISQDFIDKYNRTVIRTFINGKKRPNTRKLIYKQIINIHLPILNMYYKILNALPNPSTDYDLVQETIVKAENDFKEYIQEGNYLALKRYIFNLYKDTYLIPHNFEYFLNS